MVDNQSEVNSDENKSKILISVLVYFPKQQPAFFETGTDLLPLPQLAQGFQLTLGELFGWLLE